MAGVPAYQSSALASGTPSAAPTIASQTPDSGINRIAIWMGGWEAAAAASPEDIASVTWNGASFTKLDTVFNPDGTGSTHNGMSAWYLLDADFPGSAGTITCTVVDGGSTSGLHTAVAQITGALQEAPVLVTATGTTPLDTPTTTVVQNSLLVQGTSNGQSSTNVYLDGQTFRQRTTASSVGFEISTNPASLIATYDQGVSAAMTRYCSGVAVIKPVINANEQHVWLGTRSARQDQAKGVEYVLVGTRGAWQEQAAAVPAATANNSVALRIPRKSGSRPPSQIYGINWASPLAEGIVAAYPMRGNSLDYASGYDLTEKGSADLWQPSAELDGRVGLWKDDGHSSANLKSTDPAIYNLPLGSFTIAGWVWRSTVDTDSPCWASWLSADDIVIYGYSTTRSVFWRDTTGHHTAHSTWDTSRATLCVYSVENFTGTDPSGRLDLDGGRSVITEDYGLQTDLGPFSSFNIGGWDNPQNFGAGGYDNRIGDVFLWNRALSAEEIRALYAPQTRWDIYDQGYRRIFLPVAAAAVGGLSIPVRQHHLRQMRLS